jgi:Asp-tRNA(Asn)/Glu-tRNA(Gln) amidotransferase A subunit family amidase
MTDLTALTIRDVGELIAGRSLSAVELLQATLERIDETEPHIHAYAHVDAEAAFEAARTVDRAPRRGPLHGVPVGIKDVLETADLPTEAGSRLLAGFRPERDAVAVARLRDAGAIPVGKHVTHEFACGQDVPATRNPWELGHYPGGSSAGGGASVAVGSSLAALGTDAGGSVRKPAAVTSVVGLKPTSGRVSGRGTLRCASAPSLDHIGVFTRTVEDAALVLQAIAGVDADDRRSRDEPVPDFSADLGRNVSGLRLGVEHGYFFGTELDSEVGACVADALEDLERLGAVLVAVEIPSLELTLQAGSTILASEVAAVHRMWLNERPEEYVEATRRHLQLGSLVPSAHVEAAHRARSRMSAEVAAVFTNARLDALVSPTLPTPPMPVEEMVPAVDVPRLIPYTLPWNLTGQPALSVPCGFTAAGLPVGLQLIGRPFDEPTILRIGHAFERSTPWHEHKPRLPTTTRGAQPLT